MMQFTSVVGHNGDYRPVPNPITNLLRKVLTESVGAELLDAVESELR